jgi:hypothetical protein
MDLIKELPEGLRREIKRHLCIDLIKKVIPNSIWSRFTIINMYDSQLVLLNL